jgi:hypothetical protein
MSITILLTDYELKALERLQGAEKRQRRDLGQVMGLTLGDFMVRGLTSRRLEQMAIAQLITREPYHAVSRQKRPSRYYHKLADRGRRALTERGLLS